MKVIKVLLTVIFIPIYILVAVLAALVNQDKPRKRQL